MMSTEDIDAVMNEIIKGEVKDIDESKDKKRKKKAEVSGVAEGNSVDDSTDKKRKKNSEVNDAAETNGFEDATKRMRQKKSDLNGIAKENGVEGSPDKKKKKWYVHSFSRAWLSDDDLKDWIEEVKDNKYAVRCKVCSHILTRTNKVGLMKHKTSMKHLMNMNRDLVMPRKRGIKTSKQTDSVRLSTSIEDAKTRQIQLLIDKACEAAQAAYCPYSNNKTGAAVLTGEGIIYSGSTVENATFGLTVCAERVAILNGVSNGRRNFKALAVTCNLMPCFKYPCGSCLQVLSEFEKDCDVICIKPDKSWEKKHLLDLLPYSYCAADLLRRENGEASSSILEF